MKPIVKTLLRRFLMTLSAIVVWAKALARGSADGETQSTRETDHRAGHLPCAGGRGRVRYWPLADIAIALANVCFRG
jgi:hypothetical protein